MNILSVFWNGVSTVALMVDGEIVACVSEERFSRIKNEECYPSKAIEAVMAMGAMEPEDLDLVVVPGERFDATLNLCHKMSGFSVADRLREQHDYWYPKLLEGKEVSYLDIFADKIDTAQYPGDWDRIITFIKNGDQGQANSFYQDWRRQVISRHLGIDPQKISFIHHHRAHAYYAYYGTCMEKDRTLILTADAWGDDMNASVSVAEGNGIDMISSSTNFIIGRLYRYITLLLGMKPDEHEYKVMGLAAYAKSHYYQDALSTFQKTMFVDGLGFGYSNTPSDLYFYFKDRMEAQRFDNIAGAIQKYTEDILLQWSRNALQATKCRKLCFGGGVGMNIKAMMEISGLEELDEMMILPSPADESLAIGSAYVAMHDYCVANGLNPTELIKPLRNAYLGPKATGDELEKVSQKALELEYKVTRNPENAYIAGMIADGQVIGRCVGRSEFGARALGNRSIIADPRRSNIIKVINEKVKSRDFWMPFAPSILEEESDRYLINPKHLKAPYMTLGFHTKPAAWQDLIAGLHQADLTARPQIVSRDANPEYHALIKEFCRLTGVGGVLNTSFNVHGEPIVQTPGDALDVFQRGDLDALLLDGYLIEKVRN